MVPSRLNPLFKLGSLFLISLLMTPSWADQPSGNEKLQSETAENELLLEGKSELFTLKNAKGETIHLFKSKKPKRENEPFLWSTFDPAKKNEKTFTNAEGETVAEGSSLEGTSTDKVYENFHVPTHSKRHEIIVAVIDSGVDINHEDLKGHIWTHPKHLHCHFKNDLHGWNFLGNSSGKNVGTTTLEVTRVYAKLLAKKNSKQELTPEEQNTFDRAKAAYDKKVNDLQGTLSWYHSIDDAIQFLKKEGLEDETAAGLKTFLKNHPDQNTRQKALLAMVPFSRGMNQASFEEKMTAYSQKVDEQMKTYYNTDLSYNSSTVIGDDPEQMGPFLAHSFDYYGNNDVIGKDENGKSLDAHGTHVAGIIAADRFNHLGVLGQAADVKIMPIRAIPDGDERDKDVANAIYYAVEHGANVINMSFGKEFSPHKEYVDQAVSFAEANHVLIVHAAGNDGATTDPDAKPAHPEEKKENFPNRIYLSGNHSVASNWIEVGASTYFKNENLPAYFSNYGKTSVDLFAPGYDIDSTVPGNQYDRYNGTSMASPEVAGVAALLLSFHPKLEPSQIRDLLIKTVNQYPGLKVTQPHPDSTQKKDYQWVDFSSLSLSGGTVNAFKAVSLMKETY